MRVAKKITITVACLFIASAVVLCSLHAKDVTASLGNFDYGLYKTTDGQGTHFVKVSAELHHHGDTSVKIQNLANDHQVDTRSLRLLHSQKKDALRDRVANRMKHWWYAAMYRYS